MSVAVVVPVLGRPERVAPLWESAQRSHFDPVYVLFVCSPGDDEQIAACYAAGVEPEVVTWQPGPGDYAKKINHAYRFLVAGDAFEWVFFGADDLEFHYGWMAAALDEANRSGACVVGTNDDGNPSVKSGRHATHSLVHRDYAECGTIDDPARILHEGYDHNFVDNELVETARARGTFSFAADSIVEHLHPNWRKGEWDATYEKGQRAFEADRALFRRRQRLWGGRGR